MSIKCKNSRSVIGRSIITTSRPQRVRRSPEAARAEILQAAEAALAELPWGDLTVDELMSRTSMTRSAFYHYFSGLDEIAVGLFDQIEQDIHATVDLWFEGETEETDYRATTTRQFEQMFATVHAHRTAFVAVGQAASGHQRVYEEWQRRIVDYFVGLTARFIRREVAGGRSSVADPDRIARALILMNDAVMSASLLQVRPDSPKVLARTLSEIWNATIYGSTADA